MEREDLPNLMAFAAIVEEGSFRRAAAKLAISSSALSHAMRKLEAKVGVPLLRRTTRSISPTQAGADLLRRLRPAFEEIDHGLHELAGRRDRVAGVVRINVHRTAARLILLPKLGSLQREYPEIRVEMVLDDGLSDIVAAGCDAGIRNGEWLAKDMVAVRISDEHQTAVVGAPEYFEGRAMPQAPEDLQAHGCIGYRFVSSKTLATWRFARDGQEVSAVLDPVLVIDDIQMAIEAARHGLGLTYVLRDSVAEYLDSGDLIEALADWSVRFPADYLYYPGRRSVSPAMRAVIDHLRVRRERDP